MSDFLDTNRDRLKFLVTRAIVLSAIALVLAIGIAIGLPTQVHAANAGIGGGIDTNGDGVPDIAPGGDGTIVKQGFPMVSNADSDSWEATIYINGTLKGSIMIYGQRTLPNVQGSIVFLNTLEWGDSQGK